MYLKKILHVSSFYGNPGDYFNWTGLHHRIRKLFGEVVIDQLEIRKSYLNYDGKDKWYFDKFFYEKLNSYDKVIIGGGAMLELVSSELVWGHSIALNFGRPTRELKKIVIFSQGFDTKIPITDLFLKKAASFYEKCVENEIKIFLRNDGSRMRLQRSLGIDCDQMGIEEVIDFGFVNPSFSDFRYGLVQETAIFSVSNQFAPCKKLSRERIASLIMIAALELIDHHGMRVIFIPHLLEDMDLYSNVLSIMPTRILRSDKVTLFGLQHDSECYEKIKREYSTSRIVVSNRFHGVALAKQYERPVLAFCASNKVKALSSQLKHNFTCVDTLDKEEFLVSLNDVISRSSEQKVYCKEAPQELRGLLSFTEDRLRRSLCLS